MKRLVRVKTVQDVEMRWERHAPAIALAQRDGENTARSLHKDTWADGLGDIWNGHVPREIYDCD